MNLKDLHDLANKAYPNSVYKEGSSMLDAFAESQTNDSIRTAYEEGAIMMLHRLKLRAEELPDSLHDWLIEPFKTLL